MKNYSACKELNDHSYTDSQFFNWSLPFTLSPSITAFVIFSSRLRMALGSLYVNNIDADQTALFGSNILFVSLRKSSPKCT